MSGIEHWAEKYAHVPILSLEEMYALPESQEYDSGIYFLWYQQGLVYIGKSRNLEVRAGYQAYVNRGTHHSITAKVIPHDKRTCLVLESGIVASPRLDGTLTSYERAYIARYRPYFNLDIQCSFV